MIDLHTHTNYSDGVYSPEDLIRMASKSGLRILAITDHDTVRAYDSDIVTFAKGLGVKLVPGIEFSTIDELSNEKIHVLGLGIDVGNEELKLVCKKINQFRRDNLLSVENKLKQVGIVLRTADLLQLNATITKSHIAKDVTSNPANRTAFLEKYGDIPMSGRFIEDYLVRGKPAFVGSKEKFYTSQAVKIIQQSGGKAFCAHPSFNIMRGFDFELMKQLIIRNKFDGIETINIQYDKSNDDKRFDMVKEFANFANDSNLLVSGGSDFHNDDISLVGNHSALGLKNEDYKITDSQLKEILS